VRAHTVQNKSHSNGPIAIKLFYNYIPYVFPTIDYILCNALIVTYLVPKHINIFYHKKERVLKKNTCIAGIVLRYSEINILSNHTPLVTLARMTFSHHVNIYSRKGHEYISKCQHTTWPGKGTHCNGRNITVIMTHHFETSGSRKAADRGAPSVTSGFLSVPKPAGLPSSPRTSRSANDDTDNV
jgi:hypothetical protein